MSVRPFVRFSHSSPRKCGVSCRSRVSLLREEKRQREREADEPLDRSCRVSVCALWPVNFLSILSRRRFFDFNSRTRCESRLTAVRADATPGISRTHVRFTPRCFHRFSSFFIRITFAACARRTGRREFRENRRPRRIFKYLAFASLVFYAKSSRKIQFWKSTATLLRHSDRSSLRNDVLSIFWITRHLRCSLFSRNVQGSFWDRK